MSAPVRRVLVCEAQVPFIRGGAESLVRELIGQLRAHGYDTDLVSVPFKWYPPEEILSHAAAWRLLDLSESAGRPVDLVIATKFPTYFVRHPRKVTWLVHQYRAAYELAGTMFSEFTHTAGFGLRYLTPVGPARLDFGFNLKRATRPDGTPEPRMKVFFTLGNPF